MKRKKKEKGGISLRLHPNWAIAATTLLVFLPVFPLKFWLIDDHEIAWFLARLHSDGLAGFWHHWLNISDFGTAPRFRPVYFLLRALEILLWRDNSLMWIAARCAIAFVFAVSIFKLASRIWPPLIALLFSLSTLCVPWMPDTLFRLGPAETYAVLFIALMIFSLLPKNGQVAWLATAACITILVGIKENFAILIPLEIWAIFAMIRERKIFAAMAASALVALSLSCVVILAYKLHLSSGTDIYSQSIGSGRFNEAMKSLLFTKPGWLSLMILFACCYVVLSNKSATSRNKSSIVIFLSSSAILGFNLYFYAGVPDYHTRYAFPYWPILLSMLAVVCVHIIAPNPMRGLLFDKPMVRHMCIAAIGTVLAGLMIHNARMGHKYAEATIRTDSAISQIVQNAQLVDEIVVRTAGSMDYEPVFSIARFLEFRQLSKPLFLSVGNNEGAINFGNAEFSQQLVAQLNVIELNGGFGYEPARNRRSQPQRCLEVVFQASASSVCAKRVLVTY